MSKKELFNEFKRLFPEWEVWAIDYKKIGSKCLSITFVICDGDPFTRVFLYAGPNNWQFGTKLWRKRPERLNKKN